MSILFRIALLTAAMFVSGLCSNVLLADTITLNAAHSGWYTDNGTHNADNPNYLAGRTITHLVDGTTRITEFRNFFVFDLSAVQGTMTSVTLRLTQPGIGYQSLDASETFTLFDVSTSLTSLVASNADRTDIFTDLGSGSEFGSVQICCQSIRVDTIISFDLNAAAIMALNSNHGLFALGGALTTLGGGYNQYAFGGTGRPGDIMQLIINTSTPSNVPEPTTLVLLGMGLAGVATRVRQRHRRKLNEEVARDKESRQDG